MFYDPMIAKLITWGETRQDAIKLMRRALDEYYIRGVESNIPFLASLMNHPRFNEGRLSTNFIAEEYPDGFHATDAPHDDPSLLVAVATSVHCRYQERAAGTSGQIDQLRRTLRRDWVVVLSDAQYPVHVTPVEGGHEVQVQDREQRLRVTADWYFGQPLFKGKVNNTEVCVQVERHGYKYQLFHHGIRVDALVLTPRAAHLNTYMPVKEPPDLSKFLLSPMPGLLVSVSAEPGQEIKTGEQLAVVEAMKMENVLRAEQDAVVAKILAEPGATLEVDQPIIEFE
jgi:propionyl-CoA carboxylase alpha chain